VEIVEENAVRANRPFSPDDGNESKFTEFCAAAALCRFEKLRSDEAAIRAK
jgi:hypothetical protein